MMPEETRQTGLVSSAFTPAAWLRNRHAQTIYPSLPWPRGPRPALTRRTLELPDGDVTAVDWLAGSPQITDSTPLLIVLHGLESSAASQYVRQLLQAACDHGWHAAVLHFRDCGDYRNRLPRRYHAGETNDLRYFLNKVRTAGQDGPIMAVGYSLGGNVLLKYLGEDGVTTPLHAAAAVSVPLRLDRCAEALTTGFSRVYQKHLLKRMKHAVAQKFDRHTAAFDWERTMRARTFAEFDDAVTAPLHGFSGKDEYYQRCSSSGFLDRIERPTLIINSRDDPFMSPDIIPQADTLSASVTLEVSEAGGHVGFVSGGTPWKPEFYLPQRIIGFLETQIAGPECAVHALPGM
ncbi:MAG: hydrolase [Gammaproteobacteria bacterium]|nr:MAG: hydrolase [Gammaproteobacteria bacterium]